jgi:hypothetical protein
MAIAGGHHCPGVRLSAAEGSQQQTACQRAARWQATAFTRHGLGRPTATFSVRRY